MDACTACVVTRPRSDLTSRATCRRVAPDIRDVDAATLPARTAARGALSPLSCGRARGRPGRRGKFHPRNYGANPGIGFCLVGFTAREVAVLSRGRSVEKSEVSDIAAKPGTTSERRAV